MSPWPWMPGSGQGLNRPRLAAELADLAFRYTAQSAHLDALPKAAAAPHAALMAKLQCALACCASTALRRRPLAPTLLPLWCGRACFEALESIRSPADVAAARGVTVYRI